MGRSGIVCAFSVGSAEVNSMTKSAKTCPFIAVFGLYLISNSLNFMAHFINLPLLCVALASSSILLGLQWYEPGNKGEVFRLQLPKPGQVSPSLGTSPLLLSKLGCISRQDVVLGLCL